ncbi:spore coat associated protein CotJA [Anaerocolumna sp. MB42-C2]|uniref:spore coat associated protein CotJA n=1 Tax=Anaerocolumna sp. MB42-C2 TaxID=3070997 RepID=UPI0027DF9305|nr:spore coat associated protein CotJA [Anaerocolumna sp. MB42-C2]WMJ85336.1 spore coat associated protein CotJA [Anaerocolumna sp. MB42-C2]
MNMDLKQTDLKIAPKDCSISGIPKLPCDSDDNLSPASPSLAMAYVPIQKFRDLYDINYALQVGTLFKELDLPFYGIGGTLL